MICLKTASYKLCNDYCIFLQSSWIAEGTDKIKQAISPPASPVPGASDEDEEEDNDEDEDEEYTDASSPPLTSPPSKRGRNTSPEVGATSADWDDHIAEEFI